ncbi:MAG: hypothetical protein V5B78_11115, partial [Desulfohalobiaceae bacterium]
DAGMKHRHQRNPRLTAQYFPAWLCPGWFGNEVFYGNVLKRAELSRQKGAAKSALQAFAALVQGGSLYAWFAGNPLKLGAI